MLALSLPFTARAGDAAAPGRADNVVDPTALYLAGAEHLNRGEWASAEDVFDRVLEELPGHPDALALRGIAEYHRKKYGEARESLSAALDGGTRYAPRVLYYLGITLSMLGRHADARDVFARLTREYPASREAGELPRRPSDSAAAGDGVEGLPGRLVLILSCGYDGNAARSVELPTATEPQADTFLEGFVSAKRDPGDGSLVLGGGLFWKDFSEADTYDVVALSLKAEVVRHPEGARQLRPRLDLVHTWLGGLDFENRIGAGLKLLAGRGEPKARSGRRRCPDDAALELSAGYAIKTHAGRDYSVLDGGILDLDVKTTKRFGRKDVGLRGEFVDDTSDAEYLGYRSWRISILLRAELSEKSLFDLEAGCGGRSYKDINPTYSERREDTCWFVEASLVLSIGRNAFLRGHALLNWNDSTVDVCRYDQFIGSVGVMLLF